MAIPDPLENPAAGNKGTFPLSELDYALPEGLIAQHPAARRSDSRLLVLDRAGSAIEDRRFEEIADLLRPADLLVLNDTKVVPAKFRLERATGGRIDGLFLHERSPGRWEVMLRNASRLRSDEALQFVIGDGPVPEWTVRAGENLGQGRWTMRVESSTERRLVRDDTAATVLSVVGRTPLPPYIARTTGADDRDRTDAERYQTVYATRPGAVAAPTAGLHFNQQILDELARRGVERVAVTLHVGLGTFAPVVADDLTDHSMHAEWYSLGADAAERINRHRAAGGRIVAVGTTSVRVLESCADAAGRMHAGSGWTRIFCYPPYEFRAVDALLTNFHLPRSTLLALVMAFAGVDRIRAAYRHAVKREYRFFSYGDAMLIR